MRTGDQIELVVCREIIALMLNLLKSNFGIQNQIELASNISYSNYLYCTVRSYCVQSVWFHTWLECSVFLFSCSSFSSEGLEEI